MQSLVHLHVNKTNFHMKGFALGLALKQRPKATRKSPNLLYFIRHVLAFSSYGFILISSVALVIRFVMCIWANLTCKNLRSSIITRAVRHRVLKWSRFLCLFSCFVCCCFLRGFVCVCVCAFLGEGGGGDFRGLYRLVGAPPKSEVKCALFA